MKKLSFATIMGALVFTVAVFGVNSAAMAGSSCPKSCGGSGGGDEEGVVGVVDLAMALPSPDKCSAPPEGDGCTAPPEGDACTSGDDDKGGCGHGAMTVVSNTSDSGGTASDASFSWPFASA